MGYTCNLVRSKNLSTLAMSCIDKTQKECRPGAPFIVFRVDPSIDLNFINDQPHTGLFKTTCPILENDTFKSISQRLARNERNVKDPKKVKLFRYEDPVLGPRKMPSIDTIDDGKIEVYGNEFVFKLDLSSNQVKLCNKTNASEFNVGDKLVYRV